MYTVCIYQKHSCSLSSSYKSIKIVGACGVWNLINLLNCGVLHGGGFMLDCNAIYMLLDKDTKIPKIQQEMR